MNLKDLRIAVKMTQQEVAQKVNVTQSAVCLWETGKEKPLRKYHKLLCESYGCSMDQLQEAIKNSRKES